jgi:NTP pyrophosphatase (non-canonical NTP hydrolase)
MELKELSKQIIHFRNQRNWEQFHELKDLLHGLNIEVSELMELFLWKSKDEIEEVSKEKIKHELADIFIYLAYIAKKFDIDLEQAIIEKIELNGQKYPVSKSYGSHKNIMNCKLSRY